MDCTSCGKTLDADALFCSQCGTRAVAGEAMPAPCAPAPPPPDWGQQPYAQPPYGTQPGYAPPQYGAAQPYAPPQNSWQPQPYAAQPPYGQQPGYPGQTEPPPAYPQSTYAAPQPYGQQPPPYPAPAPEPAGMLDGLQMRRWSGDAVHNQPGMQNAQEQIVLQTQCQVSNPHMLAVDGNLVLTPSRLAFYKHSFGKWLVMGAFRNLTQGTFVFEYPLEAIVRVECSNALAWSYDTLHFTTGETHTFCFNLVNHGRWMSTLRQMLPALPINEPTITE